LDYGDDFIDQFTPDHLTDDSVNGGFITTCICHGCPWDTLKLEGKNSHQHYWSWWSGETTGKDSYQLDLRLPNGNGTIGEDEDPNGSCAAF